MNGCGARANHFSAARRRGRPRQLLGALLACLAAGIGTAPAASAARLLGRVPRDLTGTSPSAARTQPRAAPRSATTTPPCTDPIGTSDFTGCYAQLVNQFFADVAHDGPTTNVYGVSQQYGNNGVADPSRTYPFDANANTIVVHDAWPADAAHANVVGCQATPGPHNTPYDWCLTDAQIQAELSSVLGAHGWPGDMSSVYFVMLPPRIDECVGPFVEVSGYNQCADTDFCAYHSNFSDALGAPIAPLYAVMAWPDVIGCRTPQTPRGDPAADYGIDLISHEHIETANDPLGTGWYTSGANGVQDESADKCIKTYPPTIGSTPFGAYNQLINNTGYFVQDQFANADGANPSFNACEGQPGGPSDGSPFAPTGSAPLTYQGGPTMHTVRAYTIYWDGHPGASPSAAIASAPGTVHRGDLAGFQAAPATDPQGQAPSYSWSFGDGTSASGPTVSHAYQVAGSYGVTLTVSDADGYQAGETRTVRVLAPPTASFTSANAPVVAGTPVNFNAAASVAPDGTITSWSWRFGDGASASGPRVSHAYDHPGIYNATLTLTDSNGSTASETATVTVVARGAAALVASGSPRTVRAGSHVLLVLGRTLICPAGPTPCTVSLSATTTRRVSAHNATGRRTITRTVSIGTASLRPGPGSRAALALRLNATGQALLRRLHRLALSVHIVVRVEGAPATLRRLDATVGYPPPPVQRR